MPTPGDASFVATLADGMAELDGFGVRPTIYFRFDGALDPASLPDGPEATLAEDASAFLVDADTSSPDAFERVAVDVSYDADGHELRLRPAFYSALAPGRVYAAVVTRDVRDEDGRAVEGAERFVAIRDGSAASVDRFERAARARYAPLLASLDSRGVPRGRVAALAVFRVQSVGDELLDARVALGAAESAVTITDSFGADELDGLLGMPGSAGLDDGAPHDHIGFVVHGSFTSPNLLSTRAGVHGAFERTASGEPRFKRHDEVPFTLVLPRAITSDVAMPVVLVQHDLLGERSDALALANALAASGYAVFAVDAPFHGMRSGMGDRRHRFTDAALPDGFGDGAGDFAGERDAEGELTQLHPFYYRDAVRQGVVDLMQFVRTLGSTDWSKSTSALEPALQGMALDTRQIGFVGIGLGGDIGAILAAYEPSVGPILLGFPAGSGLDGWVDSPARRPMFDAVLDRLALDAESAGADALLRPELDLWRALADRGTAAAHALRLRGANVDALLLMARDDEVAHNSGTEALAHALGAQLVGSAPQYVPELGVRSIRPGSTLAGNFDLGGSKVTRVLYTLEPATHTALVYARGSIGYRHPLSAPFRELAEPLPVSNPTTNALRQAAFFFESYRACRTSASPAACGAAVMAPTASSP